MARVLIVEDETDISDLVGIVLAMHGHETSSVDNGEAALRVCAETHPDLVMLDIAMPGKYDGFEVARRLKEDPTTADIVIVMLTARAHEEDVRAGLAAGADEYVVKPFDPDDLMALVARLTA